jgi:hypothetical protein
VEEFETMPEQQRLFDYDAYHTSFSRSKDHRRKLTTVICTIMDTYGEPILSVEWCGKGNVPSKGQMLKRAWEAFHLRKRRPFGDSYLTPDGHVYYWAE